MELPRTWQLIPGKVEVATPLIILKSVFTDYEANNFEDTDLEAEIKTVMKIQDLELPVLVCIKPFLLTTNLIAPD